MTRFFGARVGGYFKDVGSPCVYALLALRHTENLPKMIAYFHDSWNLKTFKVAYSERSEDRTLPLVLKDALTRCEYTASSILKTRGRPKKSGSHHN